MKDNLRVGDKVKGKIISIGKDAVFLDTGTKTDGIVEKAELLDENGELPYHEGDSLELFVVSMNRSEIKLSKAVSGIGGITMLMDAFEGRIPVEGRVKDTCKGGFNVEVLHRRAFCPISQIDLRYVEEAEDYVGQTFQFQITQFEEEGRNIVVSRRKLLEVERGETMEKFLSTLSSDTVLEGKVTQIMPYGAFVEIAPGIEGMVHISELGWSRVDKVEDVLSKSDSVTVKVLLVEPGRKEGEKKISLSIKQTSDDPWDTVESRFKVGDKVTGRVRQCAKFGVFVEIASGLEGLVHISEMSYLKRVLDPKDMVSEGDSVSVMIKGIDTEKNRLSLSMRDAEGDPWVGIKDMFSVGQVVEGTIEKKEQFGLFIVIAPGITGLLPKSKIGKSKEPSAIEGLRAGQSIKVVIDQIQAAERKVTLAPADSQDTDNWKDFSSKSSDSGSSFGSLGDKLKAAMEKQKK